MLVQCSICKKRYFLLFSSGLQGNYICPDCRNETKKNTKIVFGPEEVYPDDFVLKGDPRKQSVNMQDSNDKRNISFYLNKIDWFYIFQLGALIIGVISFVVVMYLLVR